MIVKTSILRPGETSKTRGLSLITDDHQNDTTRAINSAGGSRNLVSSIPGFSIFFLCICLSSLVFLSSPSHPLRSLPASSLPKDQGCSASHVEYCPSILTVCSCCCALVSSVAMCPLPPTVSARSCVVSSLLCSPPISSHEAPNTSRRRRRQPPRQRCFFLFAYRRGGFVWSRPSSQASLLGWHTHGSC